jgi:hypothetical protein
MAVHEVIEYRGAVITRQYAVIACHSLLVIAPYDAYVNIPV